MLNLHQKTLRNLKHFWQSSRIQNYCIEISSFEHTNNEHTENEIKERVPFTAASKKNAKE
jgi:hypothetical protein